MLRYTRNEFILLCATGPRQVDNWHIKNNNENPIRKDDIGRIYYTEEDVRKFLNLSEDAVLSPLPNSKFATLNRISSGQSQTSSVGV